MSTEPAVALEGVVTVVTPGGDLLVSADAVHDLALTPGRRVHVTVSAPRHRRNMRGVLAERVPSVSAEEIARARRDAWGDLAG